VCNDGDWGLLESKEYLSSLVPCLSLHSSTITVSLAIRSPPNQAIQTKATSGTKEHLQILIVFLLCLPQHLFITLSFKPSSSNERNHTTTTTNKETKQMTKISCMDITRTYMAKGDTRDVSFSHVEVRFICSMPSLLSPPFWLHFVLSLNRCLKTTRSISAD